LVRAAVGAAEWPERLLEQRIPADCRDSLSSRRRRYCRVGRSPSAPRWKALDDGATQFGARCVPTFSKSASATFARRRSATTRRDRRRTGTRCSAIHDFAAVRFQLATPARVRKVDRIANRGTRAVVARIDAVPNV
jgi:hypothetical protein